MSFSEGLSTMPLKRISTNAVSPTIAVSSPRGQVSLWPLITIQVRINGAAAASISSHEDREGGPKPLQLLLPTPQTQSASSSRVTPPPSEYQGRNRLTTRISAGDHADQLRAVELLEVHGATLSP